jgi:hypothetical protein
MVWPCCGSAFSAFIIYTADLPKKKLQPSLKYSVMEPVIEQFYLDLGVNPFSPKTRKWLNILYAVVLIFSIIKSVARFATNQEFPAWTSIFFAISFVLALYFVNRKRFFPEGKFFVSITQDMLKYRVQRNSEVQSFSLQNIEYIHYDDERVGFKPYGDYWHYIISGQYTKEIFEHLKKTLESQAAHPQKTVQS